MFSEADPVHPDRDPGADQALAAIAVTGGSM